MNAFLRTNIGRNMPFDQDMKDAIANLRLGTGSDNLNKLLELNSFKHYLKMLGQYIEIEVSVLRDSIVIF